MKTNGYLNLPLAYGAEEVDLAIQLHAQNRHVLQTNWLRVYHDTAHEHHKSKEIVAAAIANTALLAYLRYPLQMLPMGLAQVMSKILYSLKHRRYQGIVAGVAAIPGKVWSNRQLRCPVSLAAMQGYLHRRKHPVLVPWHD